MVQSSRGGEEVVERRLREKVEREGGEINKARAKLSLRNEVKSDEGGSVYLVNIDLALCASSKRFVKVFDSKAPKYIAVRSYLAL